MWTLRVSKCADLTIVDALNLGDKLQSLLYYHFLPSAYTSNQLVAARTLNTDLGISTGTPYNLTFGTAQDGTAKVSFRRTCSVFQDLVVLGYLQDLLYGEGISLWCLE